MPRLRLALCLLCCLTACAFQPSWSVYPLPGHEAPLREYAKWRSVVEAEAASSSFSPAGLALWPPKSAAQWKHLRGRLVRESLLDKARLVNAFFNQQPYVEDRRAWGAEEHWARPVDFMNKGGDCEDYAIAKYFALRDVGVPEEVLRLAGVWNLKKSEGHAVLVLLDEHGQRHVLDNREQDMPLLEQTPWYKVYYFLNERRQWTHAGQ